MAHEMYLWVDPDDPDQALLWLSVPTISPDPARPNMMIVDISGVPDFLDGASNLGDAVRLNRSARPTAK